MARGACCARRAVAHTPGEPEGDVGPTNHAEKTATREGWHEGGQGRECATQRAADEPVTRRVLDVVDSLSWRDAEIFLPETTTREVKRMARWATGGGRCG